ncbi:Crp/Fnr family transcriptional regulator [Chthonomonas calidirosea]|uniref:Crp/Fnr family transcriptional regulator n=1 Tax=Chthonomonas calidirosea TaxID=454171 RepID=UPI0006EC68DB|nr:Crp/Fnr family transcriptional regulator [Chthonomonas calidirosea]CEK12472.1 cAMP-binding protein [Chthonomonas calidirosea]
MIDITLLERLSLFKGVPGDLLERVAHDAQIRSFTAGHYVLFQGDTGDALYLILQGTVKVFLNLSDGSEVFLALLGTSDVFGEMSLIDASGRSANVLTREPTKLLIMVQPLFNHLLDRSPSFGRNMLQLLARRLRMANARIRAHCTLDIYGMVAYQLLEFAALYGEKYPDGSIYIPVRLTQTDLAQLVGASRERVNQVMVAYRKTKILKTETDFRITIYKPDELRKRILQN